MNCFLSGAIVRTGGSQPCIGGAPSAKYSMEEANKKNSKESGDVFSDAEDEADSDNDEFDLKIGVHLRKYMMHYLDLWLMLDIFQN